MHKLLEQFPDSPQNPLTNFAISEILQKQKPGGVYNCFQLKKDK